MKELIVGIVGGSIAGCSAACLLARAGHRVKVFERSTRKLVERGGGIGTSEEMLRTLMDEGLIDRHFPHLMGTSMPFIIRTSDEPYAGRRPWELPLGLAAFHWATLWNNLRARLDDGMYRAGEQVVRAEDSASGVLMETRAGTRESFDLLIFADGYDSLGRSLLFPKAELRYRGYMLWRGLLPESAIPDSATLGSSVPRLSYPGTQGNAVMYFVPNDQGDTTPGARIINWAAYIPLPEHEVEAFMVDTTGRRWTGTLPPGHVRPDEEERLKALMEANLPTYYADIVRKTANTYVQLIYTVDLPAYHRGRTCLIGDAGMVAQPFTGSGVFKGYQNVRALLSAFDHEPDLDAALDSWSREQALLGKRLLALGDQMERALVWNPIDLATADAAATEAWWRASVTFPRDFSYERQ